MCQRNKEGNKFKSIMDPSTSVAPVRKNAMIRSNAAGTGGRPVTLLSNNFRIKFNKQSKIYQYDLTIQDPNKNTEDSANTVPSKGVCEAVFRDLNLGPEWAYDGKKNLYSPSGEPRKNSVKIKVGRTTYDVTVQGPVGSTSQQDILNAVKKEGAVVPVDAVNALNMVLSQGFKNGEYITIKRNFFNSHLQAPDFPGGLKLYSGISASITPTKDFGITIRVLKTHQVMYPGGELLDFVKENLEYTNGGNRGGGRNGHNRSQQLPNRLNNSQIKYFNGILKGLKLQTKHLGYPRKYTASGMHTESANGTKIEDLGVSVAQYFEGQYNIKLNYPDLPLVKAGGKNKIPIELCTILPNQPYYTTLDAAQQRDMIRKACQKPDEKVKDILQTAKEVARVTSGFTKTNYEFEIDPRAVELKGRVLNTPKMDAKNKVDRGAWNMSAVLKSGNIPAKVKIGVVSLLPNTRYTKDLHTNFMGQFARRASTLNIGIDGTGAPVRFATLRDLPQKLQGMPMYNFIVLDNDSSYGNVKLTEAVTRRTQCIKLQTIQKVCGISTNPRDTRQQRPDNNTMDNILKKLNAKTGGVNFVVDVNGLPQNIFNEPVMIVGADVTHFTRSDQKPSIAAVVATCDAQAAKYISRVKALYPEGERLSVEYISDMKNVMKSILQEFRATSKHIPSRIIYYRDGVSEGQFENTVMEELGGIQDACMELSETYKPKISVVVCTKRHKQRFVVKGQQNHSNMAPGTVVDTGVVSPNYRNFYLCSQQAIQGTSVPCHYYVLYDDNKLTIDMWQMLSFFLCHTYARCSRSVSYPAPVYYAHLACASARSRMLSWTNWADIMTPEERPSEEDIEKITRPDKFNMFFI